MTKLYLLNKLKDYIFSNSICIRTMGTDWKIELFKAKLKPNLNKYTRIQVALVIKENSSEVIAIDVYKKDGSSLRITKNFDDFMRKNYNVQPIKDKNCYNQFKINDIKHIINNDSNEPNTLVNKIQEMFDNLLTNVFGDKSRYKQHPINTELTKKYFILNANTNNVEYVLELVFDEPNHCVNFQVLDYTTKGVDDIDLFPYILNENEDNPYFLAIQQLDKLGMFKLMFDDIDLTEEYISNVLTLIKLKLVTDKLSLETKSVKPIDEKLFNIINNLSTIDKLKLLKDLEQKNQEGEKK